jgi:hypothetical protein
MVHACKGEPGAFAWLLCDHEAAAQLRTGMRRARTVLRHQSRDRRHRPFAGLVTDANTRVLPAEGKPMRGLYGVGTDAASIMGGNCPGAGITLGPALTSERHP